MTQDVAQAQLESVHALLEIDRLARECDLVLTTCLAQLRIGARTEPQLLEAGRRTWPSSSLDFGRLRLALAAGEAGGYVMRARAPETWALTDAGSAEADSAHSWVRDELARARTDVQRQAEGIVGPVTDEQAELWLQHLTAALEEGIRSAFEVFQGAIDILPGTFVIPRAINRAAITGYIGRLEIRDDAKDVIVALALEAIDRSSPFGNAIVSHVTIGHMIHAFVARRDLISARALAGSLDGKWVFLDTMLLLRLLAPPLRSGPIWDAVSAARQAGMTVVVAEHSLDEMDAVVAGAGEAAGEVEEALAQGITPGALAELVGDDAISLWLRGREAGNYTNWRSFRQAVSELTGRLARAGVSIRYRYVGSADLQTRAREALEGELRGPMDGEPARRRRAIDRDALTMAMVHQQRTSERTPKDVWPQAWVATSDTHLSGAYRALDPSDQVDIAITPSQWIALISNFSPPADLTRLATSAYSLLSDETTLAVSTSITVSEAIEIARMLQPEAALFPLERRIERMTLDKELSAAPDAESDAYRAALASRVSARRAIRAAARRQALVAASQAQRVTSEAVLDAERAAHATAVRDLTQGNVAALLAAKEEGRTLGRRAALRVAVAAFLATVGIVLGAVIPDIAGRGAIWTYAFGLGGATAAVGWWRISSEYAKNAGVSPTSMAVPTIAGTLTFVLTIAIALALSPAPA